MLDRRTDIYCVVCAEKLPAAAAAGGEAKAEEGATRVRIEFAVKQGVRPFGPPLPDPSETHFQLDTNLREFLLSKRTRVSCRVSSFAADVAGALLTTPSRAPCSGEQRASSAQGARVCVEDGEDPQDIHRAAHRHQDSQEITGPPAELPKYSLLLLRAHSSGNHPRPLYKTRSNHHSRQNVSGPGATSLHAVSPVARPEKKG